ncbi:glycoside hydrolase family 2 TIM barrel-domain containing protein [Methylomagnum ishizawai]|uniref:glycoside hydrolase family 2 TIM barrel-domain containing protein n=1 Tax=Methylomagnum ishizawai TaxID=1760988 RepID=UPI001C32F729|nr:glycoside hydrolase family 2 TIM barrel-domain containing protein [Methylomagnum ishizawai]BBL77076.1 beta-galactosidase [Methylomagnum ishizawai]
MAEQIDPRYPRPQLRRGDWMLLNGPWRFRFDDELGFHLPEDVPDWPLTIEVPFAPESRRSGIGDTGFHRACWYQRDFNLPAHRAPGARVILHCGAVDWQARVWVNGAKVAEHEGGHTPFGADITFALAVGERQTLTVWAEDDPHDLEKPRGKQDWRLEPHSIWYPRTTGIWQSVWLEIVAESHIRALRWSPDLDHWKIGLDLEIGGPPVEDAYVGVRLRCGRRVLADDTYHVIGGEVHHHIGLSDPGIDDYRNELLWSPERPTLIDAELRLYRGQTVVDEVRSYTALRSIRVQRERILLNGRPYGLRLVLDQGYWPDSLMTAPDDDALRRDVELAKAMGFNGVRKHQKIEDPRYLYWADTLGLAVFSEMPSAYRFTGKAVNRLLREWTEVIERDISHPCILIWVPFNESWGVPDLSTLPAARDAVQSFYHLTRALDPYRLVIGNDGWESSATDIIGIHDYDGDPAHIRARYGPEVQVQEVVDRRWAGGRILTLDGHPHRGQPVLLSEFGGVAYVRPEDGERRGAWGYQRVDDPEEYRRRVLALIEAARCTAMFSGFCYTQFADTFQEANGLLFDDRTPKLPLAEIAHAVHGDFYVHP